MMGHKQGVQKRLLQINNKALCVPCSSHSLNLVVADAAKSSVLSFFFGILQQLYNIFSSSVQRWSVLQSHVQLTVKNLSTTRWECRIDSVKVLYHQLPEMVEAFLVNMQQKRRMKRHCLWHRVCLRNSHPGGLFFVL